MNIKKTIKNAAPIAEFELSGQQMKYLRTAGEVALGITLLAGTITLAALAPNIFSALDKIFGKKQYVSRKNTLKRREEQLAKSFYYLRRQGYIKLKQTGNLLFVSPTKKGLKRMQKIHFNTLQIPKPKKWKKTWWIVLADIPTKQFRIAANMFQKKLKQMKFYPLQRTVWIHPFDPRDEVEAVAMHYRLNPFVTTMEVSHIDQSDRETLENFFQKNEII